MRTLEIGDRLTPEQIKLIGPLLADCLPNAVWIYVIQADGYGGLIKIGRTADPGRRLAELQRATGEKLRIVGAWRDRPEREKELHAKYAGVRVRGEWFLPATPLLRLARDFSTWPGT